MGDNGRDGGRKAMRRDQHRGVRLPPGRRPSTRAQNDTVRAGRPSPPGTPGWQTGARGPARTWCPLLKSSSRLGRGGERLQCLAHQGFQLCKGEVVDIWACADEVGAGCQLRLRQYGAEASADSVTYHGSAASAPDRERDPGRAGLERRYPRNPDRATSHAVPRPAQRGEGTRVADAPHSAGVGGRVWLRRRADGDLSDGAP